jgi:acyl-CoA reductase-like NAD-dependent aldehyde dehydrogenase
MPIQSINPATEEVLATYSEWGGEQIESAIAGSREAFGRWSHLSLGERGQALMKIARQLRMRKAELAHLITLEMGKPIIEAASEIDKSAWGCEYYAAHAEEFLAPQTVPTNASSSYYSYEPLGVILGIMPWNFPFWQVLRFAAPALMAGNSVLLKHSSNVPQCALALERVLLDAGLPVGVFQSLLISGPTAEQLIADRRISAVSLTGSSATGSRIASLAGHALKKSVLELGGSDPFIVLADADLATAASMATRARFINSGQSCISAKRFIVVEEVAEEFEGLFVEEVRRLKMGDPLDPGTQVGPLARADLRDTLERQLAASVAQGAIVATGGKPVGSRGYFYEPTVLTNVTPNMPVASEETFGPVAAVMRVPNTDEAIDVANSTDYGLGANLWTKDAKQARKLARRIEAGAVFINGMVASDPRLPFGGVKASGYGRELSSFGVREFTNVQTVWIGPAQGHQMPVQTDVE